MLNETRNQPSSGGMKLYLAVSVCKDFHQVSLWSLLLALALVVGTPRQSAPGRRVWSRWLQPPLRFSWPPEYLWNFSPPCHLHTEQAEAIGTSAHPTHPGGPALSKQQPGQLREAWFLTHCHAQIHWPKMVWAPQRGHVWVRAWMSGLTTSLISSAIIFLLHFSPF